MLAHTINNPHSSFDYCYRCISVPKVLSCGRAYCLRQEGKNLTKGPGNGHKLKADDTVSLREERVRACTRRQMSMFFFFVVALDWRLVVSNFELLPKNNCSGGGKRRWHY
eukprot:scaffold11356_cov131-Skeletonema_menzelii.AAC.2